MRSQALAGRQADACLVLVPQVVGALKKLMGSQATSVEVGGHRYSMAQLTILWLVVRQPDLRMAQIARELCLRTPTVTHHVNWLVKQALMRRGEIRGDRRTVALVLTPEGTRVIREVMARYREYLAALFTHFPETTLRRLPKVLKEVVDLLEPVTKSLDPGAVYQAMLDQPAGKRARAGKRTR